MRCLSKGEAWKQIHVSAARPGARWRGSPRSRARQQCSWRSCRLRPPRRRRRRMAVTHGTTTSTPSCSSVFGSNEVREHQAAFQAIADANGGTRAAGTPGYDASVDYVVDTLEAAGWNVTLDEFPFVFFPPPTLQQLTPVNADVRDGGVHRHRFRHGDRKCHPGGHQPRPAASVDQRMRGHRLHRPTSRRPSDIALIQRGTCTFGIKALNAQNAGAEAVIIFNQGDTPLREGLIIGTPAPRRSRGDDPGGRCVVRRRRSTVAGRFDRACRCRPAGEPASGQRDRRTPRHQRQQRGDGRRPPRLGPSRTGHQRQRERLVGAARGRRTTGQPQAAEHAALRLVGRRGGGA